MNMMNNETPGCTVIIFGASGDLTYRKLIPALYSLEGEKLLPENIKILGVARSVFSDSEFDDHLFEGVVRFCRMDSWMWPDFSERLSYLSGPYDDPETYRRIAECLDRLDATGGTQGNRLFYLAIPPTLYNCVIENLGKSGLNHSESGWTRIIIEKPFGTDLDSAHKLNDHVHQYFAENQIYRIDHYLGKETVQNILAFRFANLIFQELWGRNYIDQVQITAAEEVGVERRGGYYDQAGVLRDMLQNHLLQLLALTAMEPPAAMDAKSLRDEKVKVLAAVRPVTLADGVWGQYEGYRSEPEVSQDSNTPTFIAIKFYVDNWRWQGVPFYVRSGKYLADKNTEITLKFKEVPHQIFPGNKHMPANIISLCIQPDEGIHLRFELKQPGAGMQTDPAKMDFHYGDLVGDATLPDAYERLLLDSIQGDASLFARSDEIERAWQIVTPLLKEWEGLETPPLSTYQPGAWGPEKANELLDKDGRHWLVCCVHDPAEKPS